MKFIMILLYVIGFVNTQDIKTTSNEDDSEDTCLKETFPSEADSCEIDLNTLTTDVSNNETITIISSCVTIEADIVVSLTGDIRTRYRAVCTNHNVDTATFGIKYTGITNPGKEEITIIIGPTELSYNDARILLNDYRVGKTYDYIMCNGNDDDKIKCIYAMKISKIPNPYWLPAMILVTVLQIIAGLFVVLILSAILTGISVWLFSSLTSMFT